MKRLKKSFDTTNLPPTPPSPPQQQNGNKMSAPAYKVIGLRKKPDEPLVSVVAHRLIFTNNTLYDCHVENFVLYVNLFVGSNSGTR